VTLNPDLIRRRCADIEDAAQRLESLRGMSRADFVIDRDAQDIAVRRRLVAIESALSLCYHVSARQLRRVPEDFAGCIAGLGEARLISPELADRLQAMARFRNLLVHMYWKVDYDRVYDLFTGPLDDLRAFSRVMARLA
jgi:uncharacterized protein YutE (UPF0331/DUF86 family)